ncbi:MAG TPA: RNA-binding cell elongation regulator Jag/EloR [candidate division Zixibacteria bacterium]|nr:RNA-binding cell elongation regulator Jag/EloR [candidate division Zixibacteria bacterium]
MDYVETEGDSIDEAIEAALKALGVGRDQVTVDILAEPRRGILGFRAQKARIRASLRKTILAAAVAAPQASAAARMAEPDAAALTAKAKDVLEEILRLMGIPATIEVKEDQERAETVLEIRTENSGLLIGRKGQTLEALQYLVTRIAGEHTGEGPHVVVDIENYRERRRKSLEDMALRLGEKAKRQRKTVTVEALSAADRRIIHAALQDDPWVTTKSLGQGSYRRLLIIPEGDRKKKEEPRPGSQDRAAGKASK